MGEIGREGRLKVFGVTGLAGAGKSKVLRRLKELGFPVIDTDQISRWVVDPSKPEGQRGLWELASAFGQDIIASNGQLDRLRLRALMLAHPEIRARLESILHPKILAAVDRQVKDWGRSGARAGFVEGTRLVESGYGDRLDGILLITAPEEVRVKRLMERDKVDAESARALLRLQDENVMRGHASAVLVNDGDEARLDRELRSWLSSESLA